MRVAFVKQKYMPYGGGERYLQRLLMSCLDLKCQVHLITTAWPEQNVPGVAVHVLPFHKRSRSARIRSFSDAAEAYAGEQRFDVVFSLDRTASQDLWRAGEGVHRVWLDRRRLFEPAWKVWWAERSEGHRVMLEIERKAVEQTPFIITNSHMVRKDIQQVYGERHGEIHVVYNGVDPLEFSTVGRFEHRERIRREWDVPAEAPLLVFVGSGFHRKGLAECLNALSATPGMYLAVLGRDRSAPWEQKAVSVGLGDRVRFMGPQTDLAPFYHAADIAVLPTWFDPFPNVGLEALRCGARVLTTRFAGMAELVDESVNGRVIERPDDLEAFRQALTDLAEEPADPASVERVSASVADYTMERNSRETMQLLRKAIEQKQEAR